MMNERDKRNVMRRLGSAAGCVGRCRDILGTKQVRGKRDLYNVDCEEMRKKLDDAWDHIHMAAAVIDSFEAQEMMRERAE